MEIGQLIRTKPQKATIGCLQDCVNIRIKEICSLINEPSKHPKMVVQNYGNHFKEIDKEWRRVVSHNVLHGRRSRRFFIQNTGKFNIDTFIQDKLKYSMHHKKGRFVRMKYSYYNFFELSKMEIAMLLYKYGDELMEFELKMAVLELLFHYFNLYTEYDTYEIFPRSEWLIHSGDIEKCLQNLLCLSTEDLKSCFKLIDAEYKVQIRNRFDYDEFNKRPTPKSKDELMSVFKEGMSQTEKALAISDYWEVGSRTARAWMNRFGLTREYNSKKQKINNATTIDSVLFPPQQSNENNEQIEKLSQIIKGKNSQIQKLQSHINELTTKIQTLEDKNSKLKSAVDNPELLLEKNRLLGISNESLTKKVKELEEKLKALMELHLKTPNIT